MEPCFCAGRLASIVSAHSIAKKWQQSRVALPSRGLTRYDAACAPKRAITKYLSSKWCTCCGTLLHKRLQRGAIALAGSGTYFGSVPLLGFGLTFNESPLWAKVPFCLNAEQRKECLGAGSAASGKKIQVHAAETEGTPAPAPDA